MKLYRDCEITEFPKISDSMLLDLVKNKKANLELESVYLYIDQEVVKVNMNKLMKYFETLRVRYE